MASKFASARPPLTALKLPLAGIQLERRLLNPNRPYVTLDQDSIERRFRDILMDSDKINRWLTLAANVGVLIGLILLSLEIRHSTQATQAILHQDILGYARDHTELLISDENKELANIVFRGESEPESLSTVELDKFILFTAYRMGGWESTFVHYDEGLLRERNWQLYDAWYSSLIQRGPGYKVWWQESRHGYDQKFQDHVDRAFEQVRDNE